MVLHRYTAEASAWWCGQAPTVTTELVTSNVCAAMVEQRGEEERKEQTTPFSVN